CELSVIKDLMLGGGLQLDDLVAGGHDYVHIYVGAGVFFVVEVEQHFSIYDSHADGGNEVFHGRGSQRSCVDESLQSQAQRYKCAGDRCGACSPVGLDYVAIDPDGAFAEALEIGDCSERTSDQALNLLCASAGTSFCRFSRGA